MAELAGVSKSTFTNKIGPLPVWAWMLIGLGLAIGWAYLRDRRDTKTKEQEESTGTYDYGDELDVDLIGGNQRPPVVFQNYNQPVYLPPTGGRLTPPTAPPPVTTPPKPTTPVKPVTPLPGIKPTPKPAAPAGWWVTVSKYTSQNPPWSSTLSGIAGKFYAQGQSAWPIIWNAPQNAALKARRKDPKKIQPGDKIFVPKR